MREDGITDKQEDPFFEISPEDASNLGLADGDWARLVSRRGELEARAQIGDRVYPGLVWMALHFAQAKVNWLTHDVGDPLIGTPEYKVSAVRVEVRLEACDRRAARWHEPECESTQRSCSTRRRAARRRGRDHRPPDGGSRPARAPWEDAPGTSVLVSVLLRPPPDAPGAGALARRRRRPPRRRSRMRTALSAQIKWPNDVMLDRRKVAGILAEMRGRHRRARDRRSTSTRRASQLPLEHANAPPARCARSPAASTTAKPCSRSLLERLGHALRTLARRRPRRASSTSSARATSSSAARSRVDGVDGHGAADRARRPARDRDRARGRVLVESGEVEFDR